MFLQENALFQVVVSPPFASVTGYDIDHMESDDNETTNLIIVVFPEPSELKTIVEVSWLGSSVIILVRNHCSMVGNLPQYLGFQVLGFNVCLKTLETMMSTSTQESLIVWE
jgi:hypothetical protein